MLMVEAARQRKDVLEHILLSGPPGLGKTTLANIIASAAKSNIHTTSGPQVEKAGDLAGILTNLQKGDVLFIDEIHRMQKTVEEYLYPAMEDYQLDIIIDQGPNARSVRLNLPRFTLVGATTRSGLLTAPLLTRFPIRERLNYYSAEYMTHIVTRSAGLLDVAIDEQDVALALVAAHEILGIGLGSTIKSALELVGLLALLHPAFKKGHGSVLMLDASEIGGGLGSVFGLDLQAAVEPEGEIGLSFPFGLGIGRTGEEKGIAPLVELRGGVVAQFAYRGRVDLLCEGIVPDRLGLWLGGIEPVILAGGVLKGKFTIVVIEIPPQGLTDAFHLLEGFGLAPLDLSRVQDGRADADGDDQHGGPDKNLHHA